ncbi:MAG: UbiD family decarboxylase [Desulfovibrionaceae bacterium]|nr:UbiD family decarboxylase [Desulfovibrionaceae bacterium]
MKYRTLMECVQDLQKHKELVIVDALVDPYIALGSIQRRALKREAPAMLFTKVKGTPFPVLANLFGTRKRVDFLFRSSLTSLRALLSLKADPIKVKHLSLLWKALPALYATRPKRVRNGKITEAMTTLSQLPHVHSWKNDGGAYLTLPQVYTEDMDTPGYMNSNLGMYRVQISGNEFLPDKEVGLHYQIHRGIAGHHAKALAKNKPLPVCIYIGGPPALTVAALMPLPEGVPEVAFAGALAGFRIPFVTSPNGLMMPAEADFCLCGYITNSVKTEGPFGDHVGYYSLQHEFPVMHVTHVYHRKNAIFPFTTVGRPPQEDSIFGEFIHDITSDIIPREFTGVTEVHAVDCAGVHPLLLAIAHERYVPYARTREPEELLTIGLSLLGRSQMSLAKYLIVGCYEDSPLLSTKDIPAFLTYILERTHFDRDLHYITKTTIDTLDYTGADFNKGSKLLWVVAGEPYRKLHSHLPSHFSLPPHFYNARVFFPGILLIQGEPSHAQRGESSEDMESLKAYYQYNRAMLEGIALCVIVDDVAFASASWENFLWVTFTRSNPATDVHGICERVRNKHFEFDAPCIIDARIKPFHAPELKEDEEIERAVDMLIQQSSVLSRYLL